MIERRFTNNIMELLSMFPSVGLIGLRQVGKTTLARSIASRIQRRTIYIDLEYPGDYNKLTDPVLFLESNEDACVIIDEVQRMPGLFPVLRSLIDRNRTPGRFILLGSASPELLLHGTETLAGRIAFIEITPFNLLEVGKMVDMRHHWFYGGFPDATLATSQKASRTWLRQFVKSYVERDLPLLGFAASPPVTQRFWQMLAHHNANIWNASSFANSLDLSVPTINRYIDFFEEAFLVKRLRPLEVNSKKRLVKSPKIYIRDTGVLHHLAGIESIEALAGHMMIGSSWENYVIEQITQLLDDDHEAYFYRTQAGAEVDLVIARGLDPFVCIEVKYSSEPKISKSFQNSISDLQTRMNFIITPNSERYKLSEIIEVVSLSTFITLVMTELGISQP